MKERKAELQKLIDFKKLKGANRKPRYATRKLSIGLVSCMLGFVLLVSPQSVEASEVVADVPAAEEPANKEVKPEDNKEEAPVVEENKETEAPAKEEAKPEVEKPEIAPEAQPTAVKEAEPAKTEEKPAEEETTEEFTLSEAQVKRLEDAGFTADEIKVVEENIRAYVKENKDFDVEAHLDDVIKTKEALNKKEAEEKKNRDATKKDNETYKASASKTRVTYKPGKVGDAKEAIDKENLAKLPKDTKFEWVDKTIFNQVGDFLAEIKVTYPDGTTETIKAPISLTNGYEIDGERYSGNFYSDEKRAKTTSNGQLNVGFKMDSLESQESRDKNELGMEMSTIFGGGITASGRHKMDGYLELDDRLAKYVEKIEGSRNGEGKYNYEWERVRNSRGELTNTWRRKAFSMLAEPESKEPGRKTIFQGDAPEVTQNNNSNKITFKKSLKDIIDKEAPNVANGDLIYRFFIADENMVIQNQSISDGTIKVGKDDSEDHPNATATNNRNWFSGSHGTTTYQPDAGVNGGIAFDHFLNKNSDGGTLNNYRDMQNKDFAYRFQIDPRLLPYIDSVQAYYMDGSLTGGYNSKEFKAENEHSKYFANTYQGLAGNAREGWVEYEMRFNNGTNTLSQYTAGPDGKPQTGIRGSKGPAAWFDTTKGAKEKSAYRYKDLKPGEGYFTIQSSTIAFGSNQLNFAPGTTQAGAIRLVANFKKGVDLNKILSAKDDKDTNYYMSGYMVNSKEELIPGTVSSGHIRVVDVDGDDVADEIDDNVDIPSIPETDSDKYTPVAKEVTTPVGTVPNAKDGIEKFVDKDGKDATPTIKDYHWEKTPDVSKEGTFDNAVIVTYEDGTSERVATKIKVVDNRKDNEKYNPEVETITKEHGTPTTAEEVIGAVTIPDYPEDKTAPKITVDDPSTLPDGNTDGDFEVDVTVEYPDGSKDKVKVPVKVKKEGEKLTESEKYKPEVTPVEKEKGDEISEKDIVDAVKVPDYTPDPSKPDAKPVVTVDDKSQIPDGTSTGKTNVTVTVTYPDGSSEKVDVPVTIKDTKAPEIKNIDDKTVIEKKPIDLIKVETNEEGSTVTVDGLPEGLTFNKETGEITGTPKVNDWGKEEETRDFTVTVKAEDEAGNKAEDKTFKIIVQRDTDGDGKPDVTDPDDDNDGVSDEDEKKAGTDPKDKNDKPADKQTDAEKYPAQDPKKTEVEDKNNLTPEEKEKVKEEVKKANPKAKDVTVGNDGKAKLTYDDGSTNEIPGDKTVYEKGAKDNEKYPAQDPKKTEVEDKNNLTPEEKEKVKEEVKKANPKAKDVDVDDKGNATITYPDDSTNTIPGEKTVTEKAKTDAEKNPAVDPKKTEVEDKNNLTPEEKEKVKEEVKKANPKAKDVNVDDKGNAEIIYPDGSKNKLPSDKTVVEKSKTDAEKYPAQDPKKTEVEDKNNLTDKEKEKVKEEVKKANPKAKDVDVDDKGNAEIIYPDGSKNKLPSDKTVTEKDKKPEDGKTTVDDSNVKPVDPTDEKQGTGIIVKNPDKDTKVTAKDEDGKDVPVVINPETGEIEVTPGKNVDGPITVVIEDKDLPGGKKEIEVPVKGHEKGRDDNGSDNGSGSGDINVPFIPESNADEGNGDNKPNEDEKKEEKTDAQNNPAKAPEEKTGVKDKNHLTDYEKQEVIDKVKKANPAAIDVIVDDMGNATLIYADGSKNFINASDLVYQKGIKVPERESKKPAADPNRKHSGKNVKTGVGSVSGLIGLMGAAFTGLFASKKKEEEDK